MFSAIWVLALLLFQATYSSSCAYLASSCPQSGLTRFLAFVVLFGLIPAIMFSLLAWVLGLAKAAMLSRWGWFSAIFLLGAFALLLYLFIGPEHPPASALRARTG